MISRGDEPAPVGNVYDKHGTRNPVARRLVGAFGRALLGLVDLAAPESLVDVGCGEGSLTTVLADRLDGRRVLGLDRPHPLLEAGWAARARPNVEYRAGDAMSLPLDDAAFDVACATEVLEHVPEPRAALRELGRVARRAVIVSVPREPVWRMANVARGAYLRSMGNTPGHVNHWSRREFISLVSGYAEIAAVRSPFPWTLALARL